MARPHHIHQAMDILSIPSMIDISGVRANVTVEEVDRIAETAIRYGFICAFVMPCHTARLVELLAGHPNTLVGGVVGFPSGAATTLVKAAEAAELSRMGVDELDMVINVGELLSGNYARVRDDIRGVVEIAGEKPVKCILEVAYLSDDEIARGSLLAVEAGAAFIKTGTGWAGPPTTPHHIRLIRKAIGDAAQIKAAGGVRTPSHIVELCKAGCTRFGIGMEAAVSIMGEVNMLTSRR